jgi:hypothetical protein
MKYENNSKKLRFLPDLKIRGFHGINFRDNLDYIGYHIDKDDAHAMDLPKKEREKYFKEKYPED